MLSDFWPHGITLQSLGVFNQEAGNARRSIFIIDKQGMICWKQIYQGIIPDPKDILAELDKVGA